MQADPKKVFVVHGRDDKLRRELFAFLLAIGLSPIEWSQAEALTGKASPFIGEVLDAAFSVAQAVVVLLTGDDEAKLKSEYQKEDDPDYERTCNLGQTFFLKLEWHSADSRIGLFW